MPEEHIQIQSSKSLLYGVLYRPISTNASPPEVCIICQPLFEEQKSARRPLVELSRSLADNGYAVLLLDFSGCGDSGGSIGEFTPDDWENDLRTGIQFLKELFGDIRINLIGVRIGATIITLYANDSDNLENVILLNPIMNGQTYLDEMLTKKRVREMMTFGESKSDDSFLTDLEHDLPIDLDGFAVSPRLYHGIASINLEYSMLQKVKHSLFIQISSTDSLIAPHQNFYNLCQENNVYLDAMCIGFPPFWKTIEIMDHSVIYENILDWLKEISNGNTS